MTSRKSPAKIETAARQAATEAREAAIAAGQSEDEAAEAAEAAAAAVRKGDEPPAAPARDEDDDADPLDPEEILEKIIPSDVAVRIAKDQRRDTLDAQERALLAEACYVFGINPDPTLKPRELAAYRFDKGDPDAVTPIPAYVSMVTSGGLKVRYPIDDDTEMRLRTVYNCFRANPKTGEKEELPLPPDLTLPRAAVDGVVRSTEHQYRTGYLREGQAGRDRRSKLDDLRRQGRIR